MRKEFEIIESLEKEYVDFLVDICEIESPTLFKEGVDAVGRYISEKARKKGWDIEVFPQKVSGDAYCITMNPDAPGKPICISGHMDTVHPLGAFGKPAVKVEGDIIKGPGVSDCKGGIVGGFMAMDALDAVGYNARPVKLILQSDEENSSITSNKETIRFMCEKCEGADAFINLEPSETVTSKRILLERKGIVRYEFNVHGKAGHSAGCFNPWCASAINEAAHKIAELEKFKDGDGITCNIGIIKGGSAPNTVPEECMFTADFRFSDFEQLSQIEKAVEEISNKVYVEGTSCKAEKGSFRSPLPYSEKNYKLYERMNEIFKKEGFDTLEYAKSAGGTDAAYVSEKGIPTLDSLGIVSAGCHSLGEYGTVSGLKLCAKRLVALITEI